MIGQSDSTIVSFRRRRDRRRRCRGERRGRQADPVAARLRGGELPVVPVQAVSAGESCCRSTCRSRGCQGDRRAADDAAVHRRRGRRRPPLALHAGAGPLRKPMATRVLVGAMFGPPTLYDADGRRAAQGSARPARPRCRCRSRRRCRRIQSNARSGGTVMVETLVAPSGSVVGVTVLRSSPPFDDRSRWNRRARGHSVLRRARRCRPRRTRYLIFVFRAAGRSVPATKP